MASSEFEKNSRTQSRILLFLLHTQGFCKSSSIPEETQISHSTFYREITKLLELGLVEKRELRIMESNNVKKIVAYRLTSKGSELALDLSGNMEHPWEHRAGTVDDEILSCIDAALDSFGPKFKSTVYTRFEIMYNHGRKEIPERAKEFVSMLKLYFGVGGARSMEETIIMNLLAAFPWTDKGNQDEQDLPRVISEIRRKETITLSQKGSGTSSES